MSAAGPKIIPISKLRKVVNYHYFVLDNAKITIIVVFSRKMA